jgi:peroxiredoxin
MRESPKCLDFIVGFLLLTNSLAAAGQPKSLTAKEQYVALLKEYEQASAAWNESGKGLKLTDSRWIEHHAASPKWSFAPRFLQFAEENPTQPEAVEALLQIVEMLESGHNGDRFFFPVMTRTVRLLSADYWQDERLAIACLGSTRYAGVSMEPYLQALLAKNPDREIRAYACWALAGQREARLYHLDRIAAPPSDRPELRRTLQSLKARDDPEFVKRGDMLDKNDRTVISAETDALLQRVISEFGDVPFPARWHKAKRKGQTLADLARPKVRALQTVAVGKVAPDIQGEDIHGKPMRLADYRGKVVVIVFWGNWCGPCRGLIPHEKALVERFKKRPFALMGINSDSDRQVLQATMEKDGVTWRSWWDGGKVGGPIALRWDVKIWPAIFVLDDKGVIRNTHFPHHAHNELAEVVESLVRDAENHDDLRRSPVDR